MSSLGLHIGLGASKVLAGHVGGVENRYGYRAATPYNRTRFFIFKVNQFHQYDRARAYFGNLFTVRV